MGGELQVHPLPLPLHRSLRTASPRSASSRCAGAALRACYYLLLRSTLLSLPPHRRKQVKFEALVARLRTSVVGDDDEDDVGGMDAGGGEDGRGGRSQAYFILRAAQKRDRLQREGDELDAAIRKARGGGGAEGGGAGC